MPENKFTKNSILQRMYTNAASLWGVQSIENLDPFVRLMMEAVAANLYDLHNEIEDVRVRILESLATVLTPSILINPCPAHAIAQAYPIEPVEIIDKKTVFQDKKIPQDLQKKGIKTFSFVPINKVRLVSGKIKYLITERIFHKIEDNGEKIAVGQAHTFGEKTNQKLWIGLDLHSEIETLQGLSFYFDFPLTSGNYDKLKNLPYSKWSISGHALEMKTGLPLLLDDDEYSDDSDSLLDKYSLLNQNDDNISDYYRIHYLTVEDNIQLKNLDKTTFPPEITDVFPEHITDMPESCYWIKVVLPTYIKAKDIQDIKVYINTFPIANKILYSQIFPLSKAMTSIVPLRVEEGEHFISVEKVSDTHGIEYHEIPFSINHKVKTGYYSIKRGGIERFDRRDAAEHLDRTIDLLRSELAAFSSLNVDSMRNVISTVQEGLKQVVTKYENSSIIEYTIPNYLLLEKIDKDEAVFVEYWATNCELANSLRAGKMLIPLSGTLFQKDSCRLIVQTRGGKSEANVNGRLDAFRYVLTTRDQIITFEDIENFCRKELEEKITKVHVARGIAVSSKPKEGLIRTVDVHLTPSPGYEQIVGEIETDLLVMLHRKSPDLYNFRIMIENVKI